MPGRKRNVHLHVMVTEDELAAIHARMAEAGISNTGAYVRKMALNLDKATRVSYDFISDTSVAERRKA